jgi:hypothetical protein
MADDKGRTTKQARDPKSKIQSEDSANFTKIVNIMANTPPMSNKELVKRSKRIKK